ncbi:hypothetical protein J6590_032262 [Homalodisca vitripennis]|nr:hypothetical protein J6590_032262 [Homalodisca vitripennis]
MGWSRQWAIKQVARSGEARPAVLAPTGRPQESVVPSTASRLIRDPRKSNMQHWLDAVLVGLREVVHRHEMQFQPSNVIIAHQMS